MQTIDVKFLDLKADDEGIITGYGSVFNVTDSGMDRVVPGAFTASLRSKKAEGIKMLFQHDPAQPIGKWLEMEEDTHGLKVKGKLLTKLTKGAEVFEMVKEGVLDGLSIGFRTVKADWDGDIEARMLKEVDLWEVSLVTFPMNASARIDAVKTIRDAERVLRDGGVPGNFAKLIAKHGFEEAERIVTKDRRDGGLVGIDPTTFF